MGSTERGSGGFGSTGIQSSSQQGKNNRITVSIKTNSQDSDRAVAVKFNVPSEQNSSRVNSLTRLSKSNKPHVKSQTTASRNRDIVSMRNMKKMARQNVPMFVAIVRQLNPVQKKQKKERINKSVYCGVTTQGRTESTKRQEMKLKGPKKDFKSVQEKERELIQSVNPSHRLNLQEIVQEYRDVFPETLPKGRPPKRDVEHEIKITSGSEPPNRPPYRLGPAEQDELEIQIKDLLAQGFIRPSSSPYGAPVLFVPKKDGRWRMCVDYRALNKQTIKDKFPLPRIDGLLDRLGGSKIFSKLDLASGYHQIGMEETSIEKTAFRTNLGHWEFLVMPFRLTNAPASFQRLMNKIFADELNSFILCYMDDILVFSRSIEEHWGHLRCALQRLREAKLYGRLHKCDFLKDKVDYLGFEISSEGVHASPEKVKSVVEWPTPQSVHDVRAFLGLASYYRKFIRNFSNIARPLTDLTKKDKDMVWSEVQEESFNQLKAALASAPVLRLPDFERQFIVTTDASDVALGAVLEQNFGHGLQPVAYASRKLNKAEINYSAYERELLGIVWALGQWRHYFSSHHSVVVRTDHAPLRHLPDQAAVNKRVWKWVSIMQGYDLEIVHIPGKINPADHLSRQLLSDAAERKGLVRKDQKNFVRNLRVPADATDDEIQNAIQRVFTERSKQKCSRQRERQRNRNRFSQRERQRYRVQFHVQYQTIKVRAQISRQSSVQSSVLQGQSPRSESPEKEINGPEIQIQSIQFCQRQFKRKINQAVYNSQFFQYSVTVLFHWMIL